MSSRALVSVVVAATAALVLVACTDNRSPDVRAMESAGGLSESRFPQGIKGDTPAPTFGNSADSALHRGWYVRAEEGDKAPTWGNHVAY